MGEGGIFKQLTKTLIERGLSAELDTHLEEEKVEPNPERPKNRRNGHSKKTVKGEFGQLELQIPRDRNGDFTPKLIGKGEPRFTGFDDKILSLYARGMTPRDIQGQLQDLYGVDVSHTPVKLAIAANIKKAFIKVRRTSVNFSKAILDYANLLCVSVSGFIFWPKSNKLRGS